MAEFSAKDVKALRDSTGAGMMDAKKALQENEGDMAKAQQWLREKGLGKAASRADRENKEGVVALSRKGNVTAIVQLRSETDFVAKNADFVGLAQKMAEAVSEKGEGAVTDFTDQLDDMKITLKENIDLGKVVRVDGGEDDVVDTYLHVQDGRGKNAVVVRLAGGSQELAHDVAVHIAFARPGYTSRDEVPAEVVETERATFENISRNEGKPEAALPKIVEGRLNGFFKEQCLLEQPYVKDEKQSIEKLLGSAKLVSWDQVEIGK